MGFLGKLKFWKKEDEFGDLGKDLGFEQGAYGAGSGNDVGLGGDELGMQASSSGMPSDSWGEQTGVSHTGFQTTPQQAQASQPLQQPQPQSPKFEKPVLVQQEDSKGFGSRDYSLQQSFEVVSAKLDALKAGIDAMNQRLATLEREIRHKRW